MLTRCTCPCGHTHLVVADPDEQEQRTMRGLAYAILAVLVVSLVVMGTIGIWFGSGAYHTILAH